MEQLDLNHKVAKSIKWSSMGEIICKLITPVVNMVLARLLTPDEFGVIATISMITSLADILVDGGFQKYIIQEKFDSKEELHKHANVAFWTNLGISICLWALIAIASTPIVELVGSSGLEKAVIIASISLPLTAFSGMQAAILKKHFDFKTLFFARIVGSLAPIFVTIPLAFFGFSYWALIIGTLATHLLNAVILYFKSEWKPRIFVNIAVLRKMFSYSLWVIIEAILMWASSYAGTFIVGTTLSDYELGIYKNAINMVSSLMNILVASISAVALPALATVKDDDEMFKKMLYNFQLRLGYIIIPLGIGVFLYRDLAVSILFGSKWTDAGIFVGLYGMANAFAILIGQYVSIVFMAKGKPRLAVISQALQIIETLCLLLITVDRGLGWLAVGCSVARAMYGVINMVIGKIAFNLSPLKMLKNMAMPVIASLSMCIITYLLYPHTTNMIQQFLLIILCMISYTACMLLYPDSRSFIVGFLKKAFRRKHSS